MSAYNLFNFRTLGYGLTFTVVGFLAIFSEIRPRFLPSSAALVVVMFLSLVIANKSLVLPVLSSLKDGQYGYTAITQYLANYEIRSDLKNFENIVVVNVPPVSPGVAPNAKLYYGESANLISIWTAPNSRPDTVSSLKTKLEGVLASCVIDYSNFQSRESLAKSLNVKYSIDIDFHGLTKKPTFEKRNSYDPKLVELLLLHYSSETQVLCANLFAK
jgi:hypothetical protein